MSSRGYVPPPYGGFDPYGNAASSHQQRHPQQSQQQQQQQQGPCFEGYDPSAPPPVQQQQQHYSPYAFSPTTTNVAVPTAFMPPFVPVAGMDPMSVQNHVVQQRSGMSSSSKAKKKKTDASSSSLPHVPSKAKSSKRSNLVATPIMTFSTFFDSEIDPIGSGSSGIVASSTMADPAKPASDDSWLDTIQLNVSGVALEPLSGKDVLQRVRRQTDNVVTCYLPCVEFLVNCQQELRAGLANATQKKLVRHTYRDNLTPKQFFNRYLGPLVERFHRRNKHLMEAAVLRDATHGIANLCADSQKVQGQGCEAMKNTFLGGMKDGESWGLRKWLSKNGGALHICNDLECILAACQKLDRNKETTRKLSERLRPLAKQALGRLKNDVPQSYQEVSTAHPYLPFFHRLESALKGMANFDPEDDDVVIIVDDDEIEEVKAKASSTKPSTNSTTPVKPTAKKRSAAAATMPAAAAAATATAEDFSIEPYAKRQKKDAAAASASTTTFDPYAFGRDGTPPIKNPFDSDEDDDDSIIEIIDVKQASGGSDNSSVVNAAAASATNNNSTVNWRCSLCCMLNSDSSNRCCMCSKKGDGEVSFTLEETAGDNDMLDAFHDLAGISPFDDAASSAASKIFDLPTNTSPSSRQAGTTFDGSGDGDDSYSSNQASTSANADAAQHHVAPPAAATPAAAAPAATSSSKSMTANEMIKHLDHLTYLFDINKQDVVRPRAVESDGFWDSAGYRYARILRLLVSLIRNRDAQPYLHPIDPRQVNACGRMYADLIKHPLCFQDIVHSLVDLDQQQTTSESTAQNKTDRPCGTGILSGTPGLTTRWNMWRGYDLLQAIDLVFLNALAFAGKGRTAERSRTNRMRKLLWDEIHNITSAHFGSSQFADDEKRVTPTRRGENSGFVIHKV